LTETTHKRTQFVTMNTTIYCSICGISLESPDGRLIGCRCNSITTNHRWPPQLTATNHRSTTPQLTTTIDIDHYRRPPALPTTPQRQSTRQPINNPGQSTTATQTPSHYRQTPQQQQPTGRSIPNNEQPVRDTDCVICKLNTSKRAFIPCGHLSICMTCEMPAGHDKCPVCRQKYTSVNRIYI